MVDKKEAKGIAPIQDKELPSTIPQEEAPSQEQVINIMLESVIGKVITEEQREKYLNDSSIEKAKMLNEMLGANNLVSSMLASQMIAVHDLQTSAFARAIKNPDNQQAVNAVAKLSNVFIQQIGLMEKLQGKGQQKVTVEHVHVHNGGQAIVGSVIRGEGGSGAKENGK